MKTEYNQKILNLDMVMIEIIFILVTINRRMPVYTINLNSIFGVMISLFSLKDTWTSWLILRHSGELIKYSLKVRGIVIKCIVYSINFRKTFLELIIIFN